MFITDPNFEQRRLSGRTGLGKKCWQAVTAEFPAEAWYMFVYRGRVLDRRVNLTMLVSWEEALVEIIDSVPPEDRRTVYRIEPTGAGALTFRKVQAIWMPAGGETDDGLAVVLSMDSDTQLLTPSLRPVPRERLGRLVFEVGPSGIAGTQGHAAASAEWRTEIMGVFHGLTQRQ